MHPRDKKESGDDGMMRGQRSFYGESDLPKPWKKEKHGKTKGKQKGGGTVILLTTHTHTTL